MKQSGPEQRPPLLILLIIPPPPSTHTHIYMCILYIYICIYLYTQTYFCSTEGLMPLAWPCWCRRLSLQEVHFLCCRSLRSSPGTLYCREEEEEDFYKHNFITFLLLGYNKKLIFYRKIKICQRHRTTQMKTTYTYTLIHTQRLT